MLPANLLAASLSKLALTDKPLITATPDKSSPQPALKLEVGQRVQGTVQAQVAPNQFQVRIADQLVQMQLPAFIRSGDLVSLQVVSLQPRLTFSLAASTNPVSTSEQLSSTSRLLSSMSQQPIEQKYVRAIQPAPLWVGSKTSPDTTQLAGKLHDALSHSGLFYESHQSQWIAGMRTIPQLMQEPQNQIPAKPAANPNPVDNPAKTITPNTSSAVPVQMQNLAAQPSSSPLSSTTNPVSNNMTAPAVPAHLQNLVQQQLHTLETHQVLWQGQAWQGQEMHWEVREESKRAQADGTSAGQWVTELQLDLPNLGKVSARLSFSGGAVNLAFDVSDEKTRDTMGKASTQLINALNDRGIPVLNTSITRSDNVPT